MEEYISGFIEFNKNLEITNIIQELNKKYPIIIGGIDNISNDALDLYPSDFLPQGNFFAFCIGDDDRYVPYESCLADNIDWAPEADFNLPKKADDRIDLLIKILSDLFLWSKATRMVLALYEYSLLDRFDSVKNIPFSKLCDIIFQDIKLKNGSPNTLYNISSN